MLTSTERLKRLVRNLNIYSWLYEPFAADFIMLRTVYLLGVNVTIRRYCANPHSAETQEYVEHFSQPS
jgi:hypothetical protein